MIAALFIANFYVMKEYSIRQTQFVIIILLIGRVLLTSHHFSYSCLDSLLFVLSLPKAEHTTLSELLQLR